MNHEKETAVLTAKKAGSLLLKHFDKNIGYRLKGRFDIVTKADLGSEKLIVTSLKKEFPDYGILSEEMGEEKQDSTYKWIIDPLDGTNNFVRGIEEFCVSIALVKNDDIVLGVLFNPVTDKLFVAEKGRGASLNSRKIKVSEEKNLENMIACFDTSSKEPFRLRNVEITGKVYQKIKTIRSFGSSALHLGRIAEGKLDCYYNSSYNFWDYATGAIILKEAGGMVTDFKGNAIKGNSENILASNGKKHEEILKLINS